ncbi:MAG: DUF6268 family outer membrane beta-barrel protein [Raineya sp.]|nr:DUF6268 family outer membrane beta-barrel protein [Raineya sp.]MDW8297140.1 DUF6268 family outer membrane beta-barrel protein [Raineya sp.]
MRKFCLLLAMLFLVGFLQAQPDSTGNDAPPIDEDFSSYGDIGTGVKRYCTQKVQNLTPTKLYGGGYEVQGPFSIKSKKGEPYRNDPNYNNVTDSPEDVNVKAVHGLHLNVNYPIISKSSLIVSLTAQYQESRFIIDDPKGYSLYRSLNDRGLRTGGIGTTIFKPLNETRFMIIQAQADVNGDFGLNELGTAFSSGLTISGAFIYGWKKNDRFMWGLGAVRTYRGGETLHIPVLFYNRTFNDRWGIEVLFPARVHFRRNFSPKSLLQLGYEIVGNSYHISNVSDVVGSDLRPYDDLQLRRSEIKIRAVYEQSLKNFIWISVQAGLRYNYKFNLSEARDVKEGLFNKKFLLNNDIGHTPYVSVGVYLVSP